MTFNVLYGPPGSGKTTIADRLDKNDIDYISIGALTRKEISNQTDLGLELDRHLQQVIEYPQWLIRELVEVGLKEARCPTILFDGFPKFMAEIEVFHELAKSHNALPGKVVQIDISLEQALDRIASRVICKDCGSLVNHNIKNDTRCNLCNGPLTRREDDDPIVFTRRFNDYLLNNKIITSSLSGIGYEIVRIGADRISSDMLRQILR